MGGGGGGLQNGRGGQVMFYPYKKRGGGDEKSLSHPEGAEGTTSFGVLLTPVLEVLTILEGGTKGFTLS